VAEVLSGHVTLELEGIDRMYLNVYVPALQREQGVKLMAVDIQTQPTLQHGAPHALFMLAKLSRFPHKSASQLESE
jgi:hypothetical protein